MEEIEINEDITKDKIYKTSIDFIINYEDDILNMSELKQMKELFLQDEYYYYAEAINRAIKAIKIIFE